MEDSEEDQHLAQKPEKETPKICPLLTLALAVRVRADDVIDADLRNCIKARCALWVEGHKETIHPDYYLTHQGCGLESHIFWERKKRPPTSQP